MRKCERVGKVAGGQVFMMVPQWSQTLLTEEEEPSTLRHKDVFLQDMA
jgi:hypothetical protein